MSADNGIYIHKFRNGWKVCEAQAIENIYWKRDKKKYNYYILNRYFKNSPIFKTKKEALNYSLELSKKIIILEYGISLI